MSDERGSIKMSTANDIGTSLVTVLGGDGYSPEEWADNINLCGIHAADIENALENIEDSTGSGSERGSFLVSTANKIGAVLNKKYNTSRGFKPKEWASAISFLEPLPERTASGAVANITDGADKVPVKSWGISIPANLAGVNTLECSNAGKNLFDKNNPNEIDGYITTTGFSTGNANAKTIYIPIKGGATYTVSKTAGQRFQLATAEVAPSNNATFTKRVSQSGSQSSLTIVSEANDKYLWAWIFLNGTDSGTLEDMLASIQIEVGSSATTYEPYTAPTVSEVDLGRTVYCGSAEVVSGSGADTGKKIKLNTLAWIYNDTEYSYGYFDARYNQTDMSGNMNFACTEYINNGNARSALANGEIGVYNKGNAIKRLVIRDDSCTTLEQFLTKIEDYYLAYETTDSTPFTFDPIDPIPETEETCNFWSDEGDSTVVYRADIDSPEPNNLLGLNNSLGNSNNNTEEEVI